MLQNYRLVAAIVVVFLALSGASPQASAQNLQVWVSSGDKKVLQNQMLKSQGASITSLAFDGTTAKLAGAKNEVISAALHLEAPTDSVSNLSVSVSSLTHPSGYQITSRAASGDDLYNYVGRNIELFYIRYLQDKGLSQNIADTYDERHLPEVMRRPYNSLGTGSGGWTDRPGANKYFPDIAVPIEQIPNFSVWGGTSQMIWMDVYVPKSAPAGMYTGSINILQSGRVIKTVPISMEVFGFTLPDTHASKTMMAYSPDNLEWRFFGKGYVGSNTTEGTQAIQIRDRYFMMAHRHGIDLVDNNPDYAGNQPAPLEWPRRLTGELFTANHGYDGPGVSTPNGVFAIGLYGSWRWKGLGEYDMRVNTDAWETWFRLNAPNVERFLYLADEDEATYAQLDQWAAWVNNNPGPGSALKTFATKELPTALSLASNLSIIGSSIFKGDKNVWQNALNALKQNSKKEFFMYNGHRPASGTFYLEDDAVGPREIPWGQYKKGIDRWFVWESTYYRNQNTPDTPHTPLLSKAQTFGGVPITSSVFGETGNPYAAGGLYSNGDGVMVYPGKDVLYPDQSYGLNGPMASLRMKYWRRGIEDVDYLTLARYFEPAKVDAILQRVVPKALWEYGVNDPNDPTWVRTEISWSSDADVWEGARRELAAIISAHTDQVQQITPEVIVETPNAPTTTTTVPATTNESTSTSTSTTSSSSSTTTTVVQTSTVPAMGISKATLKGKMQFVISKKQKNKKAHLKLLTKIAKRYFRTIKVRLTSSGSHFSSRVQLSKNLSFSARNVPLTHTLKAVLVLPAYLKSLNAKAIIISIKPL